MHHLWAPWRLSYVAAPSKPSDSDECFICRGAAEDNDRQNLIAHRTAHSLVVLNRFPYNNGHLLVAPLAHKARLDALTNDELLDTHETLRQMIGLLDKSMTPDGYNVGLNLGRAAGAGVPGHLHWHIVPRWNGDTNFMPVFSETKVISQSLESLYDLLRHHLNTSIDNPSG